MYKPKTYKDNLSSREIKNLSLEIDLKLQEVMYYYEDHIPNKEKVIEIFSKIKNIRYMNAGYIDYEEWPHNKHVFIINGQVFEYKTGIGIKYNEKEDSKYNFTRLLFDAVYCFLQDAKTALDYNEDDFISNFGYEEDIKMFKTGIAVYRELQINKDKALKIWDLNTINNLYEIIQL